MDPSSAALTLHWFTHEHTSLNISHHLLTQLNMWAPYWNAVCLIWCDMKVLSVVFVLAHSDLKLDFAVTLGWMCMCELILKYLMTKCICCAVTSTQLAFAHTFYPIPSLMFFICFVVWILSKYSCLKRYTRLFIFSSYFTQQKAKHCCQMPDPRELQKSIQVLQFGTVVKFPYLYIQTLGVFIIICQVLTVFGSVYSMEEDASCGTRNFKRNHYCNTLKGFWGWSGGEVWQW